MGDEQNFNQVLHRCTSPFPTVQNAAIYSVLFWTPIAQCCLWISLPLQWNWSSTGVETLHSGLDCNWILDFLTNRPQAACSDTSSNQVLNTWATLDCVLIPLLLIMQTHGCNPSDGENFGENSGETLQSLWLTPPSSTGFKTIMNIYFRRKSTIFTLLVQQVVVFLWNKLGKDTTATACSVCCCLPCIPCHTIRLQSSVFSQAMRLLNWPSTNHSK